MFCIKDLYSFIGSHFSMKHWKATRRENKYKVPQNGNSQVKYLKTLPQRRNLGNVPKYVPSVPCGGFVSVTLCLGQLNHQDAPPTFQSNRRSRSLANQVKFLRWKSYWHTFRPEFLLYWNSVHKVKRWVSGHSGNFKKSGYFTETGRNEVKFWPMIHCG